jgi:hypothetical protein
MPLLQGRHGEALVAEVGKLNRLLEHAVQRRGRRAASLGTAGSVGRGGQHASNGFDVESREPAHRDSGGDAAHLGASVRVHAPQSLTKRVQLYGNEEIAPIKRVKYLVRQGDRVNAA